MSENRLFRSLGIFVSGFGVLYILERNEANRSKTDHLLPFLTTSLLLPLLPLTLPLHPLPLLLLTTKQDLLPTQTRSLSIPRLHTALTRELNARRASASQSSSGKIELLEDDQIPASGGSKKSVGAVLDEGVEEVLKGGGKWRWEDWKGVGWAGGWVGKAGEQQTKKSSAWSAAEEEQEKEGEGEKTKVKKEEDGLGELKEWLWNLK